MKIGRDAAFRRHLVPLFDGRSVAGLGEVQLLERFVERRDEPAFAALVARHGPMVLGVCRRLLADPLDVEDAFQATFLVLVRRAGSLRDCDRLAPWLFGVARKVASRARLDRARRAAREGTGVEAGVAAARPDPDGPARELGRALVEEIDRLPGPLRDCVLLCCVEGLSYDEAATRIGSTAPAVRGRLARARSRLRDRLTRRGFAPAAVAIGVLVSTEAAPAAVPARLLAIATGVATAGTVPAGVEILAEGVIRTMILTKSKFLASALVAFGVAGSGLGLNAQDPTPERPPAADRLDQVEKKLDRVLRALETKPAASPAPAPRGTPEVASVPSPTPSPSPAAPSPSPSPFPAPAAPRPPQPPIIISDLIRARSAPSATARIDALEQRLLNLEVRLNLLEQARGIGPEATSEPAEPPPARGSTRSRSDVSVPSSAETPRIGSDVRPPSTTSRGDVRPTDEAARP